MLAWFSDLAILLFPWGLLALFGERSKLRDALPAGVLFALIDSLLDEFGVSAGLWRYPFNPTPALDGNALWNVIAAAPEAILVASRALGTPKQTWLWIGAISVGNAIAEWLLITFTDLLSYSHWSPLFSIPMYVVILWAVVGYVRWQAHAGLARVR